MLFSEILRKKGCWHVDMAISFWKDLLLEMACCWLSPAVHGRFVYLLEF